MQTDRELMQQALDLLKDLQTVLAPSITFTVRYTSVVEKIEAALVQPEQAEPVADEAALKQMKLPCDVKIGHGTHDKGTSVYSLVMRARALYEMALDYSASQQTELQKLRGTAAPRREWQGLTDAEIAEIEDSYIVDYRIPAGCGWNFARDIEAKLKEKNNG